MAEQRWGVTIPLMGVSLADHRRYVEEIAELGFTDVWSSEAGSHDAFTPLALTAAWSPKLRLGQAVIPVYTRGPALLAQSIATLCEAAPGRVAVGIGTSSNVIVQRWNDIPFDQPYQRTRDTIRFLRAALAGEKVTAEYETFSVDGKWWSRLGRLMPTSSAISVRLVAAKPWSANRRRAAARMRVRVVPDSGAGAMGRTLFGARRVRRRGPGPAGPASCHRARRGSSAPGW